jgi:hypothetical protein
MNLRNILRYCHQLRQGAKRFTEVIHVQSRDNNPQSTVGQRFTNRGKTLIKKLRFIYTYDFNVIRKQQNL